MVLNITIVFADLQCVKKKSNSVSVVCFRLEDWIHLSMGGWSHIASTVEATFSKAPFVRYYKTSL